MATQLEQNVEILDDMRRKAEQLRDSLQSLVTATSSDVLLKLTRQQVQELNDALCCVICRGKPFAKRSYLSLYIFTTVETFDYCWCRGVGLDQRSCSASSPVSVGMGNRLWAVRGVT